MQLKLQSCVAKTAEVLADGLALNLQSYGNVCCLSVYEVDLRKEAMKITVALWDLEVT